MSSNQTLDRVLGLVRQELGCDAAHLQIGGKFPEGPLQLYTEVPNGWILVATFAEPPEDARRAQLRLREMAESFFDLGVQGPAPRKDAEQQLARRRLDDALCALAGRTGAVSALVVDLRSPVIWGSSEPHDRSEDVDAAIDLARAGELARSRRLDLALLAGLEAGEADAVLTEARVDEEDRRRLRRALERLVARPLRARRVRLLEVRALANVRAEAELAEGGSTFRRLVHQADLGYFARSFASIYVLLLVFEGPFSELHVEGAALHALPVIERHVLALPPVDPPPRGGKLLTLPVRPS